MSSDLAIRRTPTKKGNSNKQSKKGNNRKDISSPKKSCAVKSNVKKHENSNKKSFLQNFSFLSWSACTNSASTDSVIDPSISSGKRDSGKYKSGVTEESISCKSSLRVSSAKSTPQKDDSRDGVKVCFSLDESDDRSIALDKMYPAEAISSPSPCEKSPLKSILKRSSADEEGHNGHTTGNNSPASAIASRLVSSKSYLDPLVFRENPLSVNKHHSLNKQHSKPPLPPAAEPPKLHYQPFLVPEALAGNNMSLLSTSFDEEECPQNKNTPIKMSPFEQRLQEKRALEDEDFRLAMSLAEEEMAAAGLSQQYENHQYLQYNNIYSSRTASLSSSFDHHQHPVPSIPSSHQYTHHLAVMTSPGRTDSPKVSHKVPNTPPKLQIQLPIASVSTSSPQSSPKRNGVINHMNFNNSHSNRNSINVSRSSSGTIHSPNVRPMNNNGNNSHGNSATNSPAAKRNQLYEAANEGAVQAALKESMVEAEKQRHRQRMQIREQIALSRALVASVDNTFAL